jgi:hypothetical protein
VSATIIVTDDNVCPFKRHVKREDEEFSTEADYLGRMIPNLRTEGRGNLRGKGEGD